MSLYLMGYYWGYDCPQVNSAIVETMVLTVLIMTIVSVVVQLIQTPRRSWTGRQSSDWEVFFSELIRDSNCFGSWWCALCLMAGPSMYSHRHFSVLLIQWHWFLCAWLVGVEFKPSCGLVGPGRKFPLWISVSIVELFVLHCPLHLIRN